MNQELGLSPASVTVDCVSRCKSVPPDLGPPLYVKKQVDDFKVTRCSDFQQFNIPRKESSLSPEKMFGVGPGLNKKKQKELQQWSSLGGRINFSPLCFPTLV